MNFDASQKTDLAVGAEVLSAQQKQRLYQGIRLPQRFWPPTVTQGPQTEGAIGQQPRPHLMGIINVTPDSFSDGGRFLDPAAAAEHATTLVQEGASILDLGAESSRPGARSVDQEEELDRLLPALAAIREKLQKSVNQMPLISVDTYRAETAVAAIKAGADLINDISGGLYDPQMAAAIADLGCPYICQHLRGTPKTMDQHTDYNGDVVDGVYRELSERSEALLKEGVKEEQIIWDPGLGFAKDARQNWQLVLAGQRLAQVGFPVLLGPSRKRFLSQPPWWLDPRNYHQWWSAGQEARSQREDQPYASAEATSGETTSGGAETLVQNRNQVTGAQNTAAQPVTTLGSTLTKSSPLHPADPLTAQIAGYLAEYWPVVWGIRIHNVGLTGDLLVGAEVHHANNQ